MENLNTILLRKLCSAVNGHAAAATFACGGSVPASNLPPGAIEPVEKTIFSPVTLRWDGSQNAEASITFPFPPHNASSDRRLEDLCHMCQPATFGLGGRDILDEDYRKASKLDPSMFSTYFHPHDCGIVDSIQQILLPSTIEGGQGIGIGPHGVRAELYKLNVHIECHVMKSTNICQIYAAPSGKFLSHVDTPRGPTQFGSLVVCLPCSHQGTSLLAYLLMVDDLKDGPSSLTTPFFRRYFTCETSRPDRGLCMGRQQPSRHPVGSFLR